MADMIEVVCERDAPLDLGIVVRVYGGELLFADFSPWDDFSLEEFEETRELRLVERRCEL